MAGLLALVGGAEFTPGNESQDQLMVRRAPPGPAYVVSTAAARQGRASAVSSARDWFAALGCQMEELPVLTRRDASDPALVRLAAGAGFFYLLGGDPGPVAEVLRDSQVWRTMVDSWSGGAVLAGSSAGAMGLCRWVLLRDRWPDRTLRKYVPGLDVVPHCAVLPHFDTFGHRWLASATGAMPEAGTTLLGLDERTAAVWEGDRWHVVGQGSVTVVKGNTAARVYRAGDTVRGVEPPLVTA